MALMKETPSVASHETFQMGENEHVIDAVRNPGIVSGR